MARGYHPCEQDVRQETRYMMDEILEKANELGLLLQDTEIYREFKKAEQGLKGDPEAERLLSEYIRLANEIHRRQQGADSIAPYEFDALKELTESIARHAAIGEFIQAQKRYLDLLIRIQEELFRENS